MVDKRYWLIGLSYKQKCNNFGYLSIEVWLKGNDKYHIFCWSLSSIKNDCLLISHHLPYLIKIKNQLEIVHLHIIVIANKFSTFIHPLEIIVMTIIFCQKVFLRTIWTRNLQLFCFISSLRQKKVKKHCPIKMTNWGIITLFGM